MNTLMGESDKPNERSEPFRPITISNMRELFHSWLAHPGLAKLCLDGSDGLRLLLWWVTGDITPSVYFSGLAFPSSDVWAKMAWTKQRDGAQWVEHRLAELVLARYHEISNDQRSHIILDGFDSHGAPHFRIEDM